MNIYILERPGKLLDQMIDWLSEESAFNHVSAFDNEIQFLERISSLNPDLCLIRADWKNLNGLRIAETVKQKCPDCRIIMVSETRDYAVEAFEVGAHGYLISPLERNKFLRTVFWQQMALQRSGSLKHNNIHSSHNTLDH